MAVQVCKYTPNSRCRPSNCLLAVLAMFLDNMFAVKRVKCSATSPLLTLKTTQTLVSRLTVQ